MQTALCCLYSNQSCSAAVIFRTSSSCLTKIVSFLKRKRPDEHTNSPADKSLAQKMLDTKTRKYEAADMTYEFTTTCCFLLTFAIVLSMGFKDILRKGEAEYKLM